MLNTCEAFVLVVLGISEKGCAFGLEEKREKAGKAVIE